MQELARYYNYEITKENGQIKIERRVAGYTPKDSQGREYFMVAAHPYFEDYLIKQPRMIDSTIPADSGRESDRRMNELWGPGAGRFFGDVDMAKGLAFLEHTVGGFLSTLFPSHQDSARTEVQIQRENARQAALLEKMIRGKTDAEIFGTLEGAEHGALFGALMPLALGRAGGSGSASSNPIVQAIVQAYRAEKSAMKRGRIFEGLVRTLKSLPKGNLTDSVTDAGRAYKTVPDSDLGGIWEFKDAKSVDYTSQIQAQINLAKQTKQPYNLIVSELNEKIDPRIIREVQKTGGQILRLDLRTGRFELK